MCVGQGVYRSIIEYKRQPRIHGCLSDLRDGSLYRNLMEVDHQSLSSDTSITLTVNTDGVSVYKSKNISIWPVLMMINELPYVDRY